MGKRGRPRIFDREVALSRAMVIFWERGYEGTSISDLTDALGINAPSLYATFGSKEGLFREAIELYNSNSPTEHALRTGKTAKEAVEAMLHDNITAYVNPGNPAGCMIVLSAIRGLEENETVRRHLVQYRQNDYAVLQRRLKQGVVEGDLPDGTDIAGLAAFYLTVLQGLSIQANDGASFEKLNTIVEHAMIAWDALIRRPDH